MKKYPKIAFFGYWIQLYSKPKFIQITPLTVYHTDWKKLMLRKELNPYLVGYVTGLYEEVDDQLVFAYNEAHAIETILQTFDDAKFVYESKQLVH